MEVKNDFFKNKYTKILKQTKISLIVVQNKHF